MINRVNAYVNNNKWYRNTNNSGHFRSDNVITRNINRFWMPDLSLYASLHPCKSQLSDELKYN